MPWHISDSIKNLLRKRADFRKMFMAPQSLSDFRFWKGSSIRFWFRCCFSKSSCIFQILWGPVADLRFHQNLMRTMGRFWVAPKKVDQILDFEWCIQQILWWALPFQNLVHFSDSQSLESIFQKMLSKNEICFFGLTTWIRFQILTVWGVSNFRRIFDLCTIPGRLCKRVVS